MDASIQSLLGALWKAAGEAADCSVAWARVARPHPAGLLSLSWRKINPQLIQDCKFVPGSHHSGAEGRAGGRKQPAMGVSEILAAFKGLEPTARTPWLFLRLRPHKILTKMHNLSGRQGRSGKNMTRQGWGAGNCLAAVLLSGQCLLVGLWGTL